MGFDFQAVVIGGGPSGGRTAQRLAAGGWSVLLLESEGDDVDNLCSGLLNAEGQAALGCALPAHVRRAPFEPQLEFHDADNALRYRYAPGYWNMDRPSFDAWLRECAAESGAQAEYHRRVSRIEPLEHGARLRVGANVLTAAAVIDATGWRALSRKLLVGQVSVPVHGAPPGQAQRPVPPKTPSPKAPHVHAFQGLIRSAELAEDSMWAVFRTAATPYYGWLVPKGGGTFLLGAGFPQGAAHTRREGDAAGVSDTSPWAKLDYLTDYVAHCGGALELLDAKPLGCPITTITSTEQLWWGAGAVLPVGEAAGLVSPSSGDGIHFGLEHANALADELLATGLGASGVSQREHSELTRRVQRRLSGALTELRFNCLKARVGAHPLARGVAARLLPLYLRRPVQRLRFSQT